MAGESKTEKATPKKRRDERKRGNVFMSRDAVSVATLLGSFAALSALAGVFVTQVSDFMKYCLGLAGTQYIGELMGSQPELRSQFAMSMLKTAGPLLGITVLCAVVATFAQTRFLFSFESIKPKFSHISPLQGFKRLFSLKSVVEALKGILKITILLVIIYSTLVGIFPDLIKYLYVDVSVAGENMFAGAMDMIQSITIAFIALAAFDFLYQRWDYERQIKMSKQEVKEEYKQMEGNPQIKGKIREIQRRMAQSRMMQQVPAADVVIRNPTHFAVALRYKPETDSAPIVLALGQDELALRIVRTAEENEVAVIEDPPLARALYAGVELNKEIPVEFYGPVAEVLVYIFRLDENKRIVK